MSQSPRPQGASSDLRSALVLTVALALARLVALFRTPLELYRLPANDFVAGFIGGQTMNFLAPEQGRALLSARPADIPAEAATLGIRPEHLMLAGTGQTGLTGRIDVVEEFGEFALYHITLESAQDGHRELTFKSDKQALGGGGDAITLTCLPENLHFFNANGSAVLRSSTQA